MKQELFFDMLDTPIGPLTLVWTEKGLKAASYKKAASGEVLEYSKGEKNNPYRAAFEAYFAGNDKAFKDMSLDMGGTSFQRRVWQLLLEIPAGETRCYGDLAKALGNPNASRAVGWANGQNPVSIAVPCHRVIGKDGTLTGYAGGLKRKAWLLEHEGVSPLPLFGA
ncbi:MAG: methylated-DNA--[protein]-cysteine S-methyltransferase [Sphingomonadales bacterium]